MTPDEYLITVDLPLIYEKVSGKTFHITDRKPGGIWFIASALDAMGLLAQLGGRKAILPIWKRGDHFIRKTLMRPP